ncbi:MAG: Mrp/NBP35 family ATP-binding protein [Treponemataceae bacterium]|nr:Mrp/NBP35 family ATP-binding protein [Treponemataceae bacterium]
MGECSHNCSSCSEDCKDRDFHEDPNPKSSIKKVIAVVSGKGGVGKSIVTSMLSVLAERKKQNTAILDADITGPSIPKSFGIHGHAEGNEDGLFPMLSKDGIQVMSLNMLLENETDPVVWRGPVIAGAVKQFWTDVIWEDVDTMFIDMPPGTGDVPLTVFQTIRINGIIIVTSPQELVGMIVDKAVKMAEMMNIPVLGIVENMSYLECPDCGKKLEVFGKSKVEEVAAKHGIKTWSKIPINPELASLVDTGRIEDFKGDWLDNMSDMIDQL